MFCDEYLKVTHRKDLASKDLEAIWVQIKFPTTSALFQLFTDRTDLNVRTSSRTYMVFSRRRG